MVHYAAGPVARRAAGAEEQNLAGGAWLCSAEPREASARAAFESRDAGFAGYVAENIAQFTTLEGLPLAEASG